MIRRFDLNIDEVLESWEPAHAIRELISNALDEQTLTHTPAIQIYEKAKDEWIIRDFGRGLSYEHLIQNENPEKLNSARVIGKFGVGLKDALATLWRHNIRVSIKSRHGRISLERSSKHEFEELLTLHACVEPPASPEVVGTEITLTNCQTLHVEKAKAMFLAFQNSETVEATSYGDILLKVGAESSIYLNGLQIAREDNFIFSYNITLPNSAIRKALNRERMNVGRSAYSDRVKAMLLSAKSQSIARLLAQELELLATAKNHDELNWIEVQAHACQLLQSQKKVVYVTDTERTESANLIRSAQNDGIQIITIPEKLKDKVESEAYKANSNVMLLSDYAQARNESFVFKYVPIEDLTPLERATFELTDKVFDLIGGRPAIVQDVRISETMRSCEHNETDANGIWNGAEIVIKRSVLSNRQRFLGVLLHEIAHALSLARDITLEFELMLTELLGIAASAAIPDLNEPAAIDAPLEETSKLNMKSNQPTITTQASRSNQIEIGSESNVPRADRERLTLRSWWSNLIRDD